MRKDVSMIVLTVVIAFSSLSCKSVGPGTKHDTERQSIGKQGVLEGTIYRIGPGPRNDPYPSYEIVVYQEDGETEVAKTTSDENGNYKVLLSPGRYVLYTQAGTFKHPNKQTNPVVIESGKATRLDLSIDVGMR